MPGQGTLRSINISPEKGTTKQPVPRARVSRLGLENDAHAGETHRQVSLLSRESIDRFGLEARRSFQDGEFAENLTIEGLDLEGLAPGDLFHVGAVSLEVTQIGKRCHGKGCTVFQRAGRCVMPNEGVFCRVTGPGSIRVGDRVRLRRCAGLAAPGR